MNRKTAKKALVFIVCVLFIAVAFLSAAFVLTHAYHEHGHDGPSENCTACTHLVIAGNLLKLISGALVCAAFGSGRFSAALSAIKAACFHAVSSTLVHQKIKMNN